jgi:hypothetical protein
LFYRWVGVCLEVLSLEPAIWKIFLPPTNVSNVVVAVTIVEKTERKFEK